jgi:hypothetical protein
MIRFFTRVFPAFLLFFAVKMPAQELYMFRNIQKSYEKGVRSTDGRPGPQYWQNRAEYKIDATVDIPAHTISGRAAITYYNNSPDTLRLLRLKLAHDLGKKGAARAYPLPESDITDGVQLGKLRVRGQELPAEKFQQNNTFLDIRLDEPLPPGKSVGLEIPWSHKAPAAPGAPRVCVCDSTTWFNGYWYPQMAVYDDLHGWADMPYNGQQEMYNDFSDYEVRITVPAGIMVWATGIWDNPAEILKPEYLKRYEKALNSKEVVSVFSKEEIAARTNFFKKSAQHTFIYKAQGVPDFAFAFSDHYLWDACAAEVDPATGRKALVSAAYRAESSDYYEVCRVAADALELMSAWLPGYPYPYPRMTVFNGDDGMEFPMMCNDASTAPRSPIGLTVHESSHTWFPFMMGINEQYYAWMDEGWAAFFDVLVNDSLAGQPMGRLRDYPAAAGTENDMPPMTPSRQLGSAYRVAAYNRPQAAYFALYHLLGYEKFHRCMTEYINRWKGKHPQPFDFFNTWNEVSGENLNWFWKPWFFDWGYPDLAVGAVEQDQNAWQITIENRGTMPNTISGEIEYADGSIEKFKYPASVWKQGNTSHLITRYQPGKKIVRVALADPHVSDAQASNNIWTAQ